MRARPVERRSYAQAGTLLPKTAKRLRGRSVRLAPHGVMDWHSTGEREELVMALRGRLQIDYATQSGRIASVRVATGQCAFIPSGVRHCVINLAKQTSHYLYVTA